MKQETKVRDFELKNLVKEDYIYHHGNTPIFSSCDVWFRGELLLSVKAVKNKYGREDMCVKVHNYTLNEQVWDSMNYFPIEEGLQGELENTDGELEAVLSGIIRDLQEGESLDEYPGC